jgi:glutaredoxin 3
MSAPASVRLFVKRGCPWCDEAEDWLRAHGVQYGAVDVLRDRAAFAEMMTLTGQSKAPCIEVDGAVLADFGADELEEWWRGMGFPTGG